MNYQNWEFKRWSTPISKCSDITMEYLHDDGDKLVIGISGSVRAELHSWKIIFPGVLAYRNILESFRNSLWKYWNTKTMGNTVYVEGSDILDSFKLEPIPDDLKHFMIITNNDVIEIFSISEPEIIEIPMI